MKHLVIVTILAISFLSSGMFNKSCNQKANSASFNYSLSEEVFDTLPTPPDTIPVLMIKGQEGSLRMSELKINVEVLGNIARTTMEMNFENKTNRISPSKGSFKKIFMHGIISIAIITNDDEINKFNQNAAFTFS